MNALHLNPKDVPAQRRSTSTWFDALAKHLAGGLAPRQAANAGPERGPAPGFDLVDLEGRRISLATLLAPARPVLLVFTDPRCSPCLSLLPDLGGWQRVYGDRLTIALISAGDPEINRAMTAGYGIARVLVQHEQEVVEAYGLVQAPAGVLVRPDGTLGSDPAYGANAVRHLVAETLVLVVPAAPVNAITPSGRGQAAPALRRLSLDERLVDLAAYRGRPVVLVFWSPACTHCQELLPGIRAVEQLTNRPELVVVSRGAPELNRAAGLRSPMVLDDTHEIGDAFGVGGTPAAVVIDGNGLIVSEVARGSGQVGTLLDRIQTLAQTPAA